MYPVSINDFGSIKDDDFFCKTVLYLDVRYYNKNLTYNLREPSKPIVEKKKC
jgi:hypothetical protein